MLDLIGLDWGSVRCGAAFGSSTTGLVIPSTEVISRGHILEFVATQINIRNSTTIVLGLPTNFQSQPTQTTQQILKFSSLLKQKFPTINIVEFDERGSTKQARESLQGLGFGSKHLVDNLAAAKILEAYIQVILGK